MNLKVVPIESHFQSHIVEILKPNFDPTSNPTRENAHKLSQRTKQYYMFKLHVRINASHCYKFKSNRYTYLNHMN